MDRAQILAPHTRFHGGARACRYSRILWTSRRRMMVEHALWG